MKRQSIFSYLVMKQSSDLDDVFHGLPDILHTEILESAAKGDLRTMRYLIRKQADVNTSDYDKRTALHVSSACGHLEVVQFLLANGADVKRLDRWGHSAIADAMNEGHSTIEQTLRQTGMSGLKLNPNVYCPGEVTVLLMDIKNFTQSCSKLTARDVGDWISTFYTIVNQTARQLGIRTAEVRGDCCICVTGNMHNAPCGRLRSGASPDDQVTRMLLFASTLHKHLLIATPRITNVRMGIAFGDAAFLLDSEFISVHGDAVNMAARMESHAVSGMALVHVSASDRWARETCTHDQPRCILIECKGKKQQAAAIYDCTNQMFCDTMPIHYDI